jgi:hypothetical protein
MPSYADLEISLRRRDEESYEVDPNFTQPDGETVISAAKQVRPMSRAAHRLPTSQQVLEDAWLPRE